MGLFSTHTSKSLFNISTRHLISTSYFKLNFENQNSDLLSQTIVLNFLYLNKCQLQTCRYSDQVLESTQLSFFFSYSLFNQPASPIDSIFKIHPESNHFHHLHCNHADASHGHLSVRSLQ